MSSDVYIPILALLLCFLPGAGTILSFEDYKGGGRSMKLKGKDKKTFVKLVNEDEVTKRIKEFALAPHCSGTMVYYSLLTFFAMHNNELVGVLIPFIYYTVLTKQKKGMLIGAIELGALLLGNLLCLATFADSFIIFILSFLLLSFVTCIVQYSSIKKHAIKVYGKDGLSFTTGDLVKTAEGLYYVRKQAEE